MRIGIICGAGTVSGKEIMVLELADGLSERGHRVELVTARWGRKDFAEHFRAKDRAVWVTWLGFFSITLRWDCLYMSAVQLLRLPQLWLDYSRFLRRANPDRVIHTNWQHAMLLLPFLKPERDVFWIHDPTPNKPQYRRLFGWFERRFGRFVPVSHAVAQSLQTVGVPAERIHVIHNGITDPAADENAPSRNEGHVRVGIVGQIARWKGHENLVEAFRLLARETSAVELHVFGRSQDDFEAELKRKVEVAGIGERVRWHGFVADRAGIFRAMEICVVPSCFEEPFGLVAAEAGFFGLPVVASRRGGLPEIVEDGVTGFLFEAGNASELAARLRQLVQDEKLRRDMGARARARVREQFGRERFVADFVRLLEGR